MGPKKQQKQPKQQQKQQNEPSNTSDNSTTTSNAASTSNNPKISSSGSRKDDKDVRLASTPSEDSVASTASQDKDNGAGAGTGVGEEAADLATDSSRDMQEQSKALDSITDHVEERQLDSRRVEQAMATITASTDEARAAQSLREKELAAVRINASHVDIITSELDVEKRIAELRLREFKGDAVAAMRSFLV